MMFCAENSLSILRIFAANGLFALAESGRSASYAPIEVARFVFKCDCPERGIGLSFNVSL